MFHFNLTKITDTLHEDQYAFFITFRSLFFRMANVRDKLCRRNQSSYFMLCDILSKIVHFVNKCGKKSVGSVREQMTIRCMRIVCWISKAENRHSGSV
jgi:hypothetical protein